MDFLGVPFIQHIADHMKIPLMVQKSQTTTWDGAKTRRK